MKMIRGIAIAFCAVAPMLLTAAAHAAQPSVMAPGRWEVTIKTELPDSTPVTTTEICISEEQAEHPEPPKTKAGHDCQVTSGLTGRQMKYTIKCGRKNATTNGEFVYNEDRYEGVVTIKTDDYEIRQVYSAKRLGECQTKE